MRYLNCSQVYLKILWKLKICSLRSFITVDTKKHRRHFTVDTVLLLAKESLKLNFMTAFLHKSILF